jgi:hypothetical protein
MILRQARSKGPLVSKALQAFLLGVLLLATQPGMFLARDYRAKLDHKIACLNYGDPAFLVGRAGENDEAKRSVEAFLGNVPGFAVVQGFSPLGRKKVVPCDAPSPDIFRIRSPPVCSVLTTIS